jgi:cell division initiation protein
MKLTPLDIHHKEFRRSLRGYAEEEVDQFLDEVADEFERLFKENIDLSERLDIANAEVGRYKMMETGISDAIVAAQRSAQEIGAKARLEAEQVFKDAELKAKEIIHNALQQKQKVAGELVRIKAAEEEFRARFRGVLEGATRSVNEISLPQDVTVLLGDTDEGVVGDVEVSAPAGSAAPAPVAPAAAPSPSQTAPIAAVPASGFVQSLTLGESETPEVPADVELVEPSEFAMPSYDVLGERESDDDVEEID